MKSYKLVNSRDMSIEDKAIRLGYKFDSHPGQKVKDIILLSGHTKEYFFREIDCFNDCHEDYQEITQADFLALPEPIDLDDWVKVDVNEEPDDGIRIFRVIAKMDNKVCWGAHNWVDADRCTKLTQQQIDILGLE